MIRKSPSQPAAAEIDASPLLAARDVSLERAGRVILDQVSVQVRPAEVTVVIGPNGAGKTSLLRVLLGLWKPGRGRVQRRRGLRIGYMPQRLQIEPVLPLSVRRFLTLRQRAPESVLRERLERVGVPHLLHKPVQSLSGGEMQRVLLARALLNRPNLLVLDEPAQGVDIVGQGEVFKLIDDIRHETGCGVLMVSHDLHLVMAGADAVICLNQHVCCTGRPEEVSRHPEYQRLFPETDMQGIGVYRHDHDHVHDVAGEVHEHHAGCAHGRPSGPGGGGSR